MSDKQDSDFEVFLTMGEYRKFQNAEKQFNADRELMNKQKTELTSQIKSKQTLIGELKKDLAERNTAFTKVSVECLKLKETNLALEEKIMASKLDIEKNKVKQLKNLEESTRQMIDLTKKMAEMGKEMQYLQKTNKDLKAALDQTKQQTNQLNASHTTEIQTYCEENARIKSQLTQLQQLLAETSKKLEQKSIQNDTLSRKSQEMEQTYGQRQMMLVSQIQALNRIVSALKAEAEQIKTRCTSLQREHSYIMEQLQQQQTFTKQLQRKQEIQASIEPKSLKQRIVYFLELYKDKADISELKDHINTQMVLEEEYENIVAQSKNAQDKLNLILAQEQAKAAKLQQEFYRQTMLHKIQIDGYQARQNALEAQVNKLKKNVSTCQMLLEDMINKSKKEQSAVETTQELITLKDIVHNKEQEIKNLQMTIQLKDTQYKQEIKEKNEIIKSLKSFENPQTSINNYFENMRKALAEVEDREMIIRDEVSLLIEFIKRLTERREAPVAKPPHILRPFPPHK